MTSKKQKINFKEHVNWHDLLFIHRDLMIMVAFVSNWTNQRGLDFEITSMIRTEEEEKRLNAVSRTHRDGRAVDFSVKGWTNKDKIDLSLELHKRYSDIAAIGSDSLCPTPVKYHNNGNGPHGHLQVKP